MVRYFKISAKKSMLEIWEYFNYKWLQQKTLVFGISQFMIYCVGDVGVVTS